jgi:hypothetical protein
MALSHVSGMASHDAIFIAKKRLEYFFKCNILGYPTEAVEGDGTQYASPNPQNVEMPHGAFQLLRIKNRCANDFPAFASPLYAHWHFGSFSECSPPGGYRDINIKLKIGFRSHCVAWRVHLFGFLSHFLKGL